MTMRGRKSLSPPTLSLFLIATLLFTGIFTGAAHAQSGLTNTLTLTNNDQRAHLGDVLYITPDDTTLNANTIATRHINNLRGQRADQNTININARNKPVWLAFAIKNTSMADEWVLHFGDTADARQALVKDIMVFEHSTQTMLFNSMESTEETARPAANMRTMHNNALPLTIPQGQSRLYIIKIAHEGPFTGTIAPSLMTHEHFEERLQKSTLFTTGFKVIMLLFCGFILAIAFTNKAFAYLIFGIYTLLQIALVSAIDSHFLTPYGIMPDLITLLLIATIFTKWLSTQIFFSKTPYDDKSMLALVSVGGLIMASFIISLFISNTASALNHTLIILPIYCAILTGLVFSIILAYSNRTDSMYLAGSWLALLSAFSFQLATSYNIIPTSAFNINIFWVMIILQSALYITAAIYKINLDEQEDQVKKAKENRAAQSMARLQQSKETSDQARLLRVIERERELMSELREREMLRTEEMRKAKNMADEANRAKSAFLAVVSHEVRTPMNGIMGMIRLLLDTQMTKQQTEYLGTMQTSGENMMALLNDILDFEKIESGNMELESIEFDMSKLVQDVVTLMTGHAAEKETQLLTNIAPNFPRILKGDPTRLRQVLLNLVSNANKFTEKGTVTIHLQAKSLSKDENAAPTDFTPYEITCKVEDTGIGISKEAQETLFTPFTQADKSTSRKYGGTGLGLTICRKLLEAMRGQIKLESEEHVGSTFYFTLKLQGCSDKSENTQDSSKNTPAKNTFRIVKPMNILVVEDNEMNRRVLKGFLEKDSHTVTLRDSGESALETCESRMFDAIITDINLGGMDGMEFTKNLRIFPNKKTASTPVIALSGNVSKEDMKAAYAANMNGFLTKPIDPEALSKMLFNVEDGQFEQEIILPSKNMPAPAPMEYSESIDDIETTEDFDSFAEILDADDKDDRPSIEAPFRDTPSDLKIVENNEPTTFNPQFLETLAGSLPADQMRDLMKGFSDEAVRIIGELEAMINTKDAEGIYAKGHELKGMASNFGMTLIAEIAATIEKAGKEDRPDDATEDIKKLADANRRAQEELEVWLETF